ncbi:DUF1294 domain-containing protein [Rhodanobacter sp. C03]|uniref:DUF1294 domain-containing protein n=1 Tax=Rhodanobacter sp. C03 TaxID=1945858 RepID=UPI00098718B4|nr:DUF1294 domain-containing protein [Rhodanobacter sp. C03]OOG57308.1 hypothetical protein B0E48_07585 [Rhodanobacter sp. C03]
MRQQGRVVEWDDSRGYGFVVTHGTEQRIFLHIKHFATNRLHRPKVGDILTYALKPDDRGRLVAGVVAFARMRKSRSAISTSSRMGFAEVALVAFGLLLAWAVWRVTLPWFVIAGYILLSCVTFLVYRHDKQAAAAGRWRTPENTLQVLALLGGWPGAWLAQKHLRHKSSKTSFQLIFWLATALNLVGVAWMSRQ